MTYDEERITAYKLMWSQLIEKFGPKCFYCGEEVATTIDKTIPNTWEKENSIENYVPSCAFCNWLAHNMIFDTVEQKRAYIQSQRKKLRNKRTICTECLLPYTYRVHSPSLFLCAECYDQEYGTQYRKKEKWHKWLAELNDSGIMYVAHRNTKRKVGRYSLKKKEYFISVLLDEYALSISNDDNFFKSLAGII